MSVWPQIMLVVGDVERSSRFYCDVFGFVSGHGGDEYEQIMHDGELVLQLHHDGPDDDHDEVELFDPDLPRGNGTLVWIEVADFDATVRRARETGAPVTRDVFVNPNAKQSEFWILDPDGYRVVIAGPSDYRPR